MELVGRPANQRQLWGVWCVFCFALMGSAKAADLVLPLSAPRITGLDLLIVTDVGNSVTLESELGYDPKGKIVGTAQINNSTAAVKGSLNFKRGVFNYNIIFKGLLEKATLRVSGVVGRDVANVRYRGVSGKRNASAAPVSFSFIPGDNFGRLSLEVNRDEKGKLSGVGSFTSGYQNDAGRGTLKGFVRNEALTLTFKSGKQRVQFRGTESGSSYLGTLKVRSPPTSDRLLRFRVPLDTVSSRSADSNFDLDVRLLSTVSSQVESSIVGAVELLERVIVGDLPAVDFSDGALWAGRCELRDPSSSFSFRNPRVNEVVDDLIVFVTVERIDGRGGVLAAATPCFCRSGSHLPAVSLLALDESDVPFLLSSALLRTTVLHELCHALGFGDALVWNGIGLLQEPSNPFDGGTPGADSHFGGPLAIAAFDSIGGSNYTGAKVPLENNDVVFGVGSLDGHWRESVFSTELMTSTLDIGSNPLSLVTIAAFEDMGYVVDRSTADHFSLESEALLIVGPRPTVDLHADLQPGPLFTHGPDGQIVRVR